MMGVFENSSMSALCLHLPQVMPKPSVVVGLSKYSRILGEADCLSGLVMSGLRVLDFARGEHLVSYCFVLGVYVGDRGVF